jgi:hypothetical protein
MHIRFRPASTLIYTMLMSLGSVRGQETSLDTSLDFHWNSAIRQSSWFLLLEHGVRLSHESDTQAGLQGPFWRDYARSVTRSMDGAMETHF